MTIRAKLLLFALLTAVIPLLMLATIAYNSSRDALTELVNAELLSLANEQTTSLGQFFAAASSDLISWSNLRIMQDALTDDEEGELAAELGRLQQRYTEYAALLATNDQGSVISGDAAPFTSEDDQTALLTAAQGALSGRTYQSSVITLGNHQALIIAQPIRADYDPDTLIGALIGVISWPQIQQRLATIAIAGESQSEQRMLLLRTGTELLYQTQGPLPFQPSQLPNQPGLTTKESSTGSYLLGTDLSRQENGFDNPGWSLHVLIASEAAYGSVNKLRSLFLWLGAGALLMAALVGLLVSRSIIRPIDAAADRMQDISEGEGDLSATLDQQGRDETARLARAFNRFLANLRLIIDGIKNSNRQMTQSAFQVSTISGEIAQIDRDQMAGSQAVDDATRTLIASSEEVKMLTNSVRNAVGETQQAAHAGLHKVEVNLQVMQQTLAGINNAAKDIGELQQASGEIHAIIDTIHNIADQTNLLALNAAIEAARAGEQGRGFAVVADEVRSLANRTAQSTEEIAGIVNSLSDRISTTVKAIESVVEHADASMARSRETAEAFESISGRIDQTTNLSDQIASATEAQMAQLNEMQHRLQALFKTLESSSDKAHTTSLVSEDLHRIAEEINGMLARFDTGEQTRVFHKAEGEKRRNPRLASYLLVRVEQNGEWHEGVTRDLSLGGMQLEIDELLDEKNTLSLQLYLPEEELTQYEKQTPVALQGRITRHSRQGKAELYGICFESLNSQAERAIGEAFEYFNTSPHYSNK